MNFGYLGYTLVALAAYTLVAPLTKIATADIASAVVALVTNGVLVALGGILAADCYTQSLLSTSLTGLLNDSPCEPATLDYRDPATGSHRRVSAPDSAYSSSVHP